MRLQEIVTPETSCGHGGKLTIRKVHDFDERKDSILIQCSCCNSYIEEDPW